MVFKQGDGSLIEFTIHFLISFRFILVSHFPWDTSQLQKKTNLERLFEILVLISYKSTSFIPSMQNLRPFCIVFAKNIYDLIQN